MKGEEIDTLLTESGRKTMNDSLLKASKIDLNFREKIESEDRFPIINSEKSVVKVVFFAPGFSLQSLTLNTQKPNHSKRLKKKTSR